jgi:MFS family permease
VLLLTLASICSYVDRFLLVLLIGPIQHDLAISDVQFSLLTGPAFVFLYVLLGVPFARAADLFSRRAVIATGIALWSLATAACGLASTFGQLFLARMAVAVGEAALTPAAYSWIADSFTPARRARPTVTFAMGAYLGAGLAMILGGAAAAAIGVEGAIDLFGIITLRAWQVAFVMVGLPGLLLALTIAVIVPEPGRRGRPDQASTTQVIAHLRQNARAFCGSSLSFALFLILPTAFMAWVPAFLMRVHGVAAAQVGLIYGIILVAAVFLGSHVGSRIVDHLAARGRRTPAIDAALIGMGGSLPFILLMPFAGTLPATITSLALASFFFGIVNGMPALILTQMCPGRMRATAFSLYFVFASIVAAGVGPVLIAIISEYILGDQKMIGVALAVTAIVVVPVAIAALLWSRTPYASCVRLLEQEEQLS